MGDAEGTFPPPPPPCIPPPPPPREKSVPTIQPSQTFSPDEEEEVEHVDGWKTVVGKTPVQRKAPVAPILPPAPASMPPATPGTVMAHPAFNESVGSNCPSKTMADFTKACDQLLCVKRGRLIIDLSNQNMDDGGISSWCSWARKFLIDWCSRKHVQRQPNGFMVCDLNCSNNAIGDRGAHALFRLLFELQIGIRILKFFRNCLGRGAASAMGDWIAKTPVALHEVHLSHNYIPREGAAEIIKGLFRNNVYPPTAESRYQFPVWMRMEQNVIADPSDLVTSIEASVSTLHRSNQTVKNLLCQAHPSTNCKNDFCGKSRSDGSCPIGHVPFIVNQRWGVTPPRSAVAWDSRRSPQAEMDNWRISPSGPSPCKS